MEYINFEIIKQGNNISKEECLGCFDNSSNIHMGAMFKELIHKKIINVEYNIRDNIYKIIVE